ncbi:Protein phosphatase 2C 1 [Myotisia sp. PD_48]|nr:Protein phosphatase 2C 1 [Myotisia sp. PD_48]
MNPIPTFLAISSYRCCASVVSLQNPEQVKLAGSKRRSYSYQGGLLNRMFGGSTSPAKDKVDSFSFSSGSTSTSASLTTSTSTSASKATPTATTTTAIAAPTTASRSSIINSITSSSRASRHSSLKDSSKRAGDKAQQFTDKKRRSSSVNKAAALFSSARNSLHFSSSKDTSKPPQTSQSPLQILGKMDPALIVPQGSLNNSAGESLPTPRSSFRVGVTEDKNKKCRRTMEDTHAYLYNFIGDPIVPPSQQPASTPNDSASNPADSRDAMETDNGYFAIFDGHAGSFAAEWCGKKLHLLLEEAVRNNPNTSIPTLLDQTFTSVDQQLEQLPLKNSGCTAVTAVLRWEDRPHGPLNSAPDTSGRKATEDSGEQESSETSLPVVSPTPEEITSRFRVLYTANVGDARIILCRNGKALRLSYDHKGSDENEGVRITNAGGLILNNRVNGVLAVTRALGDAYMKELVTGHPFTTETVIQPETDEFLILACDGLWDVCSDQEAVDLVRNTEDPQAASKILVDYALSRFSTDNLSCMIVRFDTKAITEEVNRSTSSRKKSTSASTPASTKNTITESDKIVESAKKTAEDSGDSNKSTNTPESAQKADSSESANMGLTAPKISLPETDTSSSGHKAI